MPAQNAEELHTAPEWLTKDYVQDKLRKYYHDRNLHVKELRVKPATTKGENYASVMTRIQVDYSRENDSKLHSECYLVKATYESEDPVSAVFKSYGIYTREIDVYESILPKLSELLSEIGDTDKLFATTIAVDREHSAIIFEDLSTIDYVMADRIARLDMEHVKIAVRKLAKIHATTSVLNERKPGTFADNYDRGIINRHTDAFKPMFTGVLAALTRYVEKQPELREKYHGKLVKLGDNIMEYGARVYDVTEKDFMTLTHGDYWTNNMMFKYTGADSPQDVIPIDFQFAAWGSPAVDLHYFFNSSLREEMRLHQQPELLQYYYNILSETLRQLKYKGHIPSLFEFCMQFEARGFFALCAAFVCQPIMMCENTEHAEFNNLISDSETGIRFKDSLFANEKIQKNVERLLPIFDRKGILDVLD